MADFSIIEFIVYAIVGYSGVLVMIFQLIKFSPPQTKSEVVWRMIWIFPSIIALGMLMAVDADVELVDTTVTEIITTNFEAMNTTGAGEVVILNSTSVHTTTELSFVSLRDPVWAVFHLLLFMVLIIYQVMNYLYMFIKIGKKDND